MSEVTFEDEQPQFTSRKLLGESVQPKMVTLLVRAGVVRNAKQAGFVLIGFAITMFVLSFYLFGSNIQFSLSDLPFSPGENPYRSGGPADQPYTPPAP